MLSAEERYRLIEEASELSERWEFAAVLRLLRGLDLDDLRTEPELGCYVANALYQSSYLDEAYELAQALAEGCAARGRDRVYCRRLLIIANVEVARGDLDGGTAAYLEILAHATRMNAQRLIAVATMNLATVAWLKCDYATALSSFSRAIAAFETLHDTYRLAGCYHNLAMVYKELSLFKEAAQDFDMSRMLFVQAGREDQLIFNDYERALLMHLRGEGMAGEQLAQNAYEKAVGSGLLQEQGETLRVLGIIHRDCGRYNLAERAFREGLSVAEQTEAKLLCAELLEESAVLYGELGKAKSAGEHAEEAREMYIEMGSMIRAAKVESRLAAALTRSSSGK